MHGSQSNPESPNRYAFLKQTPVNTNQLGTSLSFLSTFIC